MYPNDAPATDLSGYWSDGAYTPYNIVAYIKDNYTPVDKNSMLNSVGKNLSMVENFVNLTYLARSGNYIQDSYLKNLHTGHLISSGWLSATNFGSITLCSNLTPAVGNESIVNGVSLGTAELNWANVYTTNIYGSYISGVAGAGFLATRSDIVPASSNSLALGTVLNRFGAVVTSGCYADLVETDYLLSPSFVSTSDPGTVYLCSNLSPQFSGIALGTVVNRYTYTHSMNMTLSTGYSTYSSIPNDAAKATTLWVDASGYVRRGDF